MFRLLKRTNHNIVNQFCKRFYGQKTSSHKGKYRYRIRGLLDDIPYVKLIRGVIIIHENNAKKIVRFLKKYNAEIYIRDIILTHKDEKSLQIQERKRNN